MRCCFRTSGSPTAACARTRGGGSCSRSTRPFFPEVLVASSVMAEGVDLHQDCRHVIHHDLDWNPSTLEQRTGRIDRIGSKAEAVQQPVVIYEPYLGGTHDEKMFRVVKDRERWFGVVMGETPRRASAPPSNKQPGSRCRSPWPSSSRWTCLSRSQTLTVLISQTHVSDSWAANPLQSV